MGLFDMFFDKPNPPADEPDLDQARCHHYTLAHTALRSVVFDDPLAHLAVLASPDAPRFLASLLRAVTDHCKDTEPVPPFSAADIKTHPARVGLYPCAVVEMPLPRATPEAYFTAADLLADPADGVPDPVTMRYFTLEKGLAFDGPPVALMCEWTADGTHCNFGGGPEPRLDEFLKAIEGLLARRE